MRPKDYGPAKTLYNRWKRWGEAGVFVRMMEGLAAVGADPKTVMIDATYLKHTARHRALRSKGGLGRLIGRTKGGMNTKFHAVADANGCPLSFFLTAGPVSDYTGAAALLDDLPKAQGFSAIAATTPTGSGTLLQRRASNPAFQVEGLATRPSNTTSAATDAAIRIEIMFGRLKDWRVSRTRYDRCPTIFFSAIALAATVLFWL